jgi:hypothetical protein
MSRSTVRTAALAAASIAAVAVLASVLAQGQTPSAVVPPPLTPARDDPPPPRRVTIPRGFLTAEQAAAKPPEDPDVRWHRSDAPNLPPLVSPCGGRPRSDAAWVGGRQLVLVHPSLWKAQRLVVFRDVAAARAAMAERRAALSRCRRRSNRDGTTTVWTSRALRIGDEAMFVASQRYRGDRGVPGHGRGVVMRKGRTVTFNFDMGQATAPADLGEVANHVRDARVMARRLGAARWARR